MKPVRPRVRGASIGSPNYNWEKLGFTISRGGACIRTGVRKRTVLDRYGIAVIGNRGYEAELAISETLLFGMIQNNQTKISS